ncbi:MAG: hypothetical protein ACLQJR_19090 [Stellaceae bacterium]
MAEFPELEWRIARLPPLSRGLHLAGPRAHAERLVVLWRSDGPVPLSEAFRLLDADMVAGAILRTIAASEDGYPDPRHWRFPDLEALLPELRACLWQEIQAGHLLVKADRRTLPPKDLARLTADWQLSELCRSGRAEFVGVTARRRPPAASPQQKKQKRHKPIAQDAIKAATMTVAESYPADAKPPFDEFWGKLKKLLPGIPRRTALAALNDYAPHLKGKRGYQSKQADN